MQMSINGPTYQDPVQLDNFYRLAVQRIEAIPGVEAAATVTSLPLELGPDLGYKVVGQEGEYGAQWRAITPDYFNALRIRLIRGRAFAIADTSQATPVVIVNESFAKRHWPGRDAVGERIVIGANQNVGDPPRLIVGVVADVKEGGLDSNPPLITYLPTAQVPPTAARMINALIPAHWVIRTKGDPLTVVQAVKKELRAVDPLQAVSKIRTMDQVLSESLSIRSISAGLLGVFAALALLLASIGVYGVMSYSIAQRTHEIGIRMALGASNGSVVGMILRQAGLIALAGVGCGLLAAGAMSQALTKLVYGISATSPSTFAGVAAVLFAVALFASYLPARRALRVDPVTALHAE